MPANAAAVPQANRAPVATAKKRKGAACGAAACGDGAKLMARPLVRASLLVKKKPPNNAAAKKKDFMAKGGVIGEGARGPLC